MLGTLCSNTYIRLATRGGVAQYVVGLTRNVQVVGSSSIKETWARNFTRIA